MSGESLSISGFESRCDMVLLMKTKNCSFVLLVLLLAGCGTTRVYEGAERSDSEVVKIRGMDDFNPIGNFLGTSVCEIDGKKFETCQSHLEFLPGTHTLILRLSRVGIPSSSKSVTQTFRAGDRYLLGVEFGKDKDLPALMFDYNVNESGAK
jgi:hypothetical protein